jgi:hypothetical protein
LITQHGDAFSALTVGDDQFFGPGAVTRDSDSGLDWLDLTVTAGKSRTAVGALLASVPAYRSWRYATEEEVSSLYSHAGIAPLNVLSVPNFAPVSSLLDRLGITGEVAISPRRIGHIGITASQNVSGEDSFIAGALFVGGSSETLGQGAGMPAAQTWPRDQEHVVVGSYLVRAVPEPTIANLLYMGMLLGIVAWYRGSKSEGRTSAST